MASDCNWRLEAISKAAQNRKKISFVLKEGENTVGKTKGIQIKIPSVLCSREHCTIFLDDGKVTLKDTVSYSKTIVLSLIFFLIGCYLFFCSHAMVRT